MTNVTYIADRDGASFRGEHMTIKDHDSGECSGGISEPKPKPRSERDPVSTRPEWGGLSADPRFLDDVSRAYANAPDWNRSTESANARVLAITTLALACLGVVSELVGYSSPDSLSTTMLGSANLVFLSGLCWLSVLRIGPPRNH